MARRIGAILKQYRQINPYKSPTESNCVRPKPTIPDANSWRTMPWGYWLIVGVLVPGLAYWQLARNQRAKIVFALLLLAIPAAYLFFGPFWDLVLFNGTALGQAGLYPFWACLAATTALSLAIAVFHKLQLSDNNAAPTAFLDFDYAER